MPEERQGLGRSHTQGVPSGSLCRDPWPPVVISVGWHPMALLQMLWIMEDPSILAQPQVKGRPSKYD